MEELSFEEHMVNHYMTIHILTTAFREQIESTQNTRCLTCNNHIFSDNPTFTFCVSCADEMEDLDMLEEQVRTRTLPETSGFFFGQDSYTWEGEQEDMKAYDLKFCKEAKEAISQGWKVFYECWW